MSRIAVVNKDDKSFPLLNSKFKIQNSKIRTYGMSSGSDVNPKTFPFKSNLIGEFNKYNILAAVAACKTLGIEDNQIRRGIESFEPPKGREDIVYEKIGRASCRERV